MKRASSVVLLLAAACVGKAAAAQPQEEERRSRGPVIRSMPPSVHQHHERLWRQYEREHRQQPAPYQPPAYQPAPYSPVQRAPRQPVYEEPAREYAAPAPPSGPRRPPEFHDFGDTFAEVATAHVIEQARKTKDVFEYRDPQTGQFLQLKLLSVPRDRVVTPSASQAYGCVEFETVASPKRRVDLDFHLAKDDWEWQVARVAPHGERHMAPAAPAAAAAAAVPRPKAPASLSVQVSFQEPSGDDILDGGERGGLLVSVSNAGPGPAYALRLSAALSAPAAGLAVPAELALGDLEKGRSLSREVPLQASEEIASQRVALTLEVREGNGFDADPVLVEFETRAFQPPRLEVTGLRLGSGGVVRAGEPTTVLVTVKNAGRGPARGAVASLSLGSPDIFMSGEPSLSLGNLDPGRSAQASFEFFVNKRYKGSGPLPVFLTVSESRGRYGLGPQNLNLALGQAAPALKIVSVKGEKAAPSPEGGEAVEDVDEPPASKNPLDPEAYAVLIGIEKYRDVPTVDYAAADAQALHAYLTRSLGFDAKNVALLQNDRATKNDLATYLGPWLADRVGPKSRVFVFYAGHGAPDPKTGEAFLIPFDGNPAYTDTTAYPLKQLYASLAKLPAREVIVTLDACFSGSGGRSVIAKGARPLVHASHPGLSAGPNTVVLTATGADQISTFHPDGRHGLLTYFLLKALRGEADSNRDGRVTTVELYEYLKPNVEREARRQHVEQSPTIVPEAGKLGRRAKDVWIRLK